MTTLPTPYVTYTTGMPQLKITLEDNIKMYFKKELKFWRGLFKVVLNLVLNCVYTNCSDSLSAICRYCVKPRWLWAVSGSCGPNSNYFSCFSEWLSWHYRRRTRTAAITTSRTLCSCGLPFCRPAPLLGCLLRGGWAGRYCVSVVSRTELITTPKSNSYNCTVNWNKRCLWRDEKH